MGGSKMEFDLLKRSILSNFTTGIRVAELISGTCWQRSSREHRALIWLPLLQKVNLIILSRHLG